MFLILIIFSYYASVVRSSKESLKVLDVLFLLNNNNCNNFLFQKTRQKVLVCIQIDLGVKKSIFFKYFQLIIDRYTYMYWRQDVYADI